MERTVETVSLPPSSSSSDRKVAICVADTEPVESGCVGGANCTVAFGRATVLAAAGAPGERPVIGAVRSGTVGAPVAPVLSLMVGAGAGRAVGGPAVLRGIVGAGAGGALAVGAGTVATGGGVGALTVGVGGFGITGADGGATGASLAFSVTRTVSFFKGMLEVCLEGVVFCSSLMD